MEYAAALEKKRQAQAERIIALKASVKGQNIITNATEYVSSTVTAGGNNKDLKELRLMMNQLTASVSTQAATLVVLSVKTHSGGGGGGCRKNTEMKKARPVLHMCTHYNREVYHKDRNCLGLEVNKANHYTV